MSNLLNPVLLTVLGDPITLAKVLSSLGLALDVLGVVVLLTQDLRTRQGDVEHESFENQTYRDMERRAGGALWREAPVFHDGRYIPAGAARRLQAAALLRGTRSGLGLILAGFVLQLAGTLIS